MTNITAPKPVNCIWTGPQPWSPTDIIGPKPGPWPTFLDRIMSSPFDETILAWPAGQPPSGSGACYYTVAEASRKAYEQAWLIAKTQKPTRTIGLYVGLQAWKNAFEIGADASIVCDPFNLTHREGMWRHVIERWQETFGGISRVIFDAGSSPPNRTAALGWCDLLRDEYGIQGSIEAFALGPGGTLDGDIARQVSQFADWKFNPVASSMTAPKGALPMWVYPQASAGPSGPVAVMDQKQMVDYLQRGFGIAPDFAHYAACKAAYDQLGIPYA